MRQVLLLIALVFLIAAFNPQSGFSWLIGKMSSGSVASDIPTTVLASLALRSAGAELQSQQGLAWVKSQQDTSGCFPSGSCRVKDTVFAHLLLYQMNEDTAKTDAWLRSSLSSALTNGDWWLQVATSSNGTCSIAYEKNGQQRTQSIVVDQGRFPLCSTAGGETFFDLNNCLEPGLLTNVPFIQFDVDCSSLGSTVIAAVFQSGNTFYLLDEASTSRATIKINNGCFGRVAKGTCDKETSLYANWVLAETANALSVTPWLESVYDPAQVLDNALLSAATRKDIYVNNLKGLQRTDGSFQTVYNSAFAVFALKKAGTLVELDKAVDWLKSQQKSDGSWNSNELDTAATLYTAFADTQVSVPSCSNGLQDGDESGVDCGGLCGACSSGDDSICGDFICDSDENPVSCPQDCADTRESCNNDGVCDSFLGETANNCANDCEAIPEPIDDLPVAGVCGDELVNAPDEVCDGADDNACPGLCTTECLCEEGKSSLRWILPLLVILLIGFAVYYFFGRRRPPAGKSVAGGTANYPTYPSSPPHTAQQQSQVQIRELKPSKSAWENDLDKSLSEAKRLFERK